MPGLKLIAELGGDGRGFDAMMNRAQGRVNTFASQLVPLKSMIAGAFSIGAITQLVRKTTDYADRIDETSTRLGVATDRLQEWEYAAKKSGASAEQLLKFIEKLTIAAADPKKTKFFEQMGFNPAGMTPEQIFSSTASFARGTSSVNLTSILSEIIGERFGGVMVNTLQSDLEGLGDEARRLGAVLDQQTVQALAKLNDQFAILSQMLYGTFGPALLEAGKLALTAFYGIKGIAGAAGVVTQNIGAKDVLGALAAAGGGPGAIIQLIPIIKKLRAGIAAPGVTDPVADAMEKLAESLAALERVTPFTPGTVTIAEAPERAVAKARNQPLLTDALVGVGNFLGRNPGLIQDISVQQLTISRQQLHVQQQMLVALRAAGSSSAMSMEIPSQ